jgi:positive regulator of sigma E activity
MSQKIGRVTSRSNDGWAMVVTQRGNACNNCEASSFCDSLTNCTKIETKVLNPTDAGVGDHVSIQLSLKKTLTGAFFLYLVPSTGLLLGALMGAGFSNHLTLGETAAALVFGLVGLTLGFMMTAIIAKRRSVQNGLAPIITRVIRPH